MICFITLLLTSSRVVQHILVIAWLFHNQGFSETALETYEKRKKRELEMVKGGWRWLRV
jgi:hypothetical protein